MVDQVAWSEARALHDECVVLDLHADTLKLVHRAGYDLGARHKRRGPRALNLIGHIDLPRMREGGVAAQVFAMWAFPYPKRGCARAVHGQLDAMGRTLESHHGELELCLTGEDIRRAKAGGKIAALCGIEGGQAVEGRMAELQVFARRGVRSLGLVHFSKNAMARPAFGVGTADDEGLSDFGRDVVREMNRLGVIVDLAHINRKGFFEALELTEDPVFVSHTGVAGAHEHWRNIDDEQLRAVADNGGAVGIIFAPRFLGGKGVEAVVDHILHVMNVAGPDVAALGSDFDGFVVPPVGLEDAAMFPTLTAELLARGVKVPDIEKILGGNALRVLDAVPPHGYDQPLAS